LQSETISLIAPYPKTVLEKLIESNRALYCFYGGYL